MCGIIGGFHTDAKWGGANGWALKTFEDQHSRGMKGFGIIGWNKLGKIELKRSCEPAKFMFDIHAKDYPCILIHHRTPTSTDNKMDQTHPILVSNGSLSHDYLVIHNGVISNDDDLYKIHTEELGFVYTTYDLDKVKNTFRFNDSECVAIEVARFIEGQTKEVGTIGSCAFIAVQLDKEKGRPTGVFFGRNESNPLKIGASRGKIHLSSEGEGEPVEPFQLWSFEPKGDMKLTKRPMTFKTRPPVVYTAPIASPHIAKYEPKTEAAERNWEKWKNSGSSFDDEEDAYRMDKAPADSDDYGWMDIEEKCIDEVEDEVRAYLQDITDPDAALISKPDHLLKAIRDIVEEAQAKVCQAYAELEEMVLDEEGKEVKTA
jgi:hypothetical protein